MPMENKELISGKRLSEEGLSRALEKANSEFPGWSKRCYELFKIWVGKKESGFQFMVEAFRQDVYKWQKIEKPNSERAFGFLSKRAMKEGLIKQIGTAKVSNAKAHSANANLYVKI